jgi:hypothetical protein
VFRNWALQDQSGGVGTALLGGASQLLFALVDKESWRIKTERHGFLARGVWKLRGGIIRPREIELEADSQAKFRGAAVDC